MAFHHPGVRGPPGHAEPGEEGVVEGLGLLHAVAVEGLVVLEAELGHEAAKPGFLGARVGVPDRFHGLPP